MAHKKAGGSTRNGRDSKSKRRGVKLFEGQFARAGSIIIRQKGTNYRAGDNCRMGVDFTIFCVKDGKVAFEEKKRKHFNGQVHRDIYVSVKQLAQAQSVSA